MEKRTHLRDERGPTIWPDMLLGASAVFGVVLLLVVLTRLGN